jgi:hypothetical protein
MFVRSGHCEENPLRMEDDAHLEPMVARQRSTSVEFALNPPVCPLPKSTYSTCVVFRPYFAMMDFVCVSMQCETGARVKKKAW